MTASATPENYTTLTDVTFKRERENGLHMFVEDIKAKSEVRYPGDFAHCAVRVDKARHVFVS